MPDSLPFQQINTQIATGNSVQKKLVLAHKGGSGAHALPIPSSQTNRTSRWNTSQGLCRAPHHRKIPFTNSSTNPPRRAT